MVNGRYSGVNRASRHPQGIRRGASLTRTLRAFIETSIVDLIPTIEPIEKRIYDEGGFGLVVIPGDDYRGDEDVIELRTKIRGRVFTFRVEPASDTNPRLIAGLIGVVGETGDPIFGPLDAVTWWRIVHHVRSQIILNA